jgi:capsular polysaccharide transport system permease protein
VDGFTGISAAAPTRGAPAARRRRFWPFILFVLLPTVLTGAFFFGYAADQYESEAVFLVRGRHQGGGGGGLLGEVLSSAGFKSAGEEAQAVRDYLQSHDAVRDLRGKLDIVALWRRPEADFVTRLWWAEPEAERLLRYYRGKVDAVHDSSTGLTTLRARGFRAEDAKAIADQLLAASEALVNRFSERSTSDTLRVAREEVALAERRVAAARDAITEFRQREHAVDPTRSAAITLETIGQLEGALTQAKAELQERQAFMRPDNPHMQNLRNRIAALTAQIDEERRRATVGDATVSQQIAAYERLMLEREFADRQLASATASLETARADAQRQQLFLVRVVEPNLAERAEYPRAGYITVSVFVSLLVLYGIGWLLFLGVREHAS